MSDLPVTQIYDLGTVPQAGIDVHITVPADVRENLAKWASIQAVDNFSADIELTKTGLNRFSLEARWNADIVQSCVVTLEPVTARLQGAVSRDLHLIRRARRSTVEPEPALPAEEDEDEARENIDSPLYDLAAPILEDFALSIDPYPRKQGAAFDSVPAGEDKPESPFAALKSLKIDR
jgi:hypothetical protein